MLSGSPQAVNNSPCGSTPTHSGPWAASAPASRSPNVSIRDHLLLVNGGRGGDRGADRGAVVVGRDVRRHGVDQVAERAQPHAVRDRGIGGGRDVDVPVE